MIQVFANELTVYYVEQLYHHALGASEQTRNTTALYCNTTRGGEGNGACEQPPTEVYQQCHRSLGFTQHAAAQATCCVICVVCITTAVRHFKHFVPSSRFVLAFPYTPHIMSTHEQPAMACTYHPTQTAGYGAETYRSYT